MANSIFLLLAACSAQRSADTPAAMPAPSATETAVVMPSSPPPPPPVSITVAVAASPQVLDPANATDETALMIVRHLYEGLTAYAPGTTRPVPALAESWQVSDDGLTWTFHLRPGVRFGDGTPLTAMAAAANFRRWIEQTPPGEYVFWNQMFGSQIGQADENGMPLALLTAVETAVDDPLALILRLSRPEAALPATLAMPSFALVSPAAFGRPDFGAPGAPAFGTGPYLLGDWLPEMVRLKRNPDYWGRPPAPDELIFKVIADDTQRVLALMGGEVEAAARPNPRDYAAVSGGAHSRLVFDPALNVVYLGFNQAHAPWNNLDCRLAVAQALDRTRYVKEFFSGDADEAAAMLPPAVWGYADPGTRPYDPAQAAAHWQACIRSPD